MARTSASSTPFDAATRSTVIAAARQNAFDDYLCALLAPRATRDDLVTFAAYTGEIGRIPRTVSDAALGEIRLQWWRDSIESGAPTGNPVADCLISMIARRGLAIADVVAPLDGRAHELYGAPFANADDFNAYLDTVEGARLRTVAAVCGLEPTQPVRSLIEGGGAVLGITRLLLRLPQYLAMGHCPIPLSLTGGEDPCGLTEAAARERLEHAVVALAAQARVRFYEMKPQLRGKTAVLWPVLRPLALSEPYLRALTRSGHDPLRQIADVSPLSRVIRLWTARLT